MMNLWQQNVASALNLLSEMQPRFTISSLPPTASLYHKNTLNSKFYEYIKVRCIEYR